jgi:hypothetical protein
VFPRLAHQVVVPTAEELDRLPFEFALPALVLLEDRFRRRAEGAVVEEVDIGVEEEEIAQTGRVVTHGVALAPIDAGLKTPRSTYEAP